MDNPWLDSVVEAHHTYFGGEADVVMDVGTRDGDDAEFLREKLNAKRVIAIDANPVAVELTKANYPKFKVIETAVSDRAGVLPFLQINSDNKDWMGTSSLDESKAWRDDLLRGINKRIEVQVVRLDTLLEELGIDTIDVMKIDVESYTYEALIGLGDRRKDVKVFHLETERKYHRLGHRNNNQIAALMRSQGFFLVDVSYEWGQNIQDQVWINTELSKVRPRIREVDQTL